MAKTIARGQITIVDLNDGRSINLFLGCNQPSTQLFNKDNSSYVPNYATSPFCVITPEVYVSGTSTDQVSQIKGKPVWKINGGTKLEDYGATAATTSPYALTIKKNLDSSPFLKIECTVIYVDPDTTAETTAKAVFTITKHENTTQMIRAIAYAPNGNTFKNGNFSELTARCDMYRGSTIDNTLVTYKWQRMVDGKWTDITSVNASGITGFTTHEITIPADAVLNYEIFKCIITDVDETSGTRNTSVSDIVEINDSTDPYTVEIFAPAGNILPVGSNSTTLTANLWQNGEKLPDSFFVGATCRWRKYNKDGVANTEWGTNGVKESRTITVTRDELTIKATYAVEIVK